MIQKVKGTYDLLNIDVKEFEYIEQKIKHIAELCEYSQIKTPIIENTNVFLRNEFETSDCVTKEMYTFLDKAGRSISLRPEGTASIVRSYIENKLYVNDITKLYYLGPMFRYERQQKGRYRQFNQFGLELLGSNSPYSDVDIISTGVLILKALGIKNVRIHINTLGDKISQKKYSDALVKYFMNHKDKLCVDCQNRLLKNPLRILDCKIDKENDIFQNIPQIKDYLTKESIDHFEIVKQQLKIMNIEFYENPYLVRGLDYYNHTVFEIESLSFDGSNNIICAGGRYNSLVKDLGGPENIGCVGLAFGIERIHHILKLDDLIKLNKDEKDVYLISLSNEALSMNQNIMGILRNYSLKTNMGFELKSLKSQFKQASNYGARFILILGDDELKYNKINIKDTKTQVQETILIKDILKYIVKIKVNERKKNSCGSCKGCD